MLCFDCSLLYAISILLVKENSSFFEIKNMESLQMLVLTEMG